VHELPVTRSILDIVLRYAEANQVGRVVAIDLSIGALSDLEPEWIQSYFDHLSQGTVAEGAEIRAHRSPLSFRCGPCGTAFEATREELASACCPACGSREISVTSGTGYIVESMEVQECPT
jgi:hydrogenase nickel incorporation protein HypA/HybF